MNDNGTIYILKNESLPNQYKVGRTIRDLKIRVSEYSVMGLETKFEPIFTARNNFHRRLEAFIHSELISYRIDPRKEYFNFDNDGLAISAVTQAIDKFNKATEGVTDLAELALATPITRNIKKVCSITLRVTDDLPARLKKAAYRSEMSQSEFITLALEAQVQRTLKEAKP